MIKNINVDLSLESSKRRILDHMIKESEAYQGHLIYNANKNGDGYGMVSINNRRYYVHRLACWIYLNLDLDNPFKKALHERRCDRKDCWNLKHLYIGSQKDNMQDKNSKKTHCPQGHEYSPENTIIFSDSSRRCKICREEYSRRWKALHVRGM
jgi:hypothetical protein